MSKTISIPVDEGELAYVQMLDYEVTGLRVLLRQVLRTGRPSNEVFERFLARYNARNTEFNIAFSELVKQYAPEYRDGAHTFRLEYNAALLLVDRKEGCTC